MIKSISQKGGASISRTRLGINTVGAAMITAAIWTGAVVRIPRVWTVPVLTVVFTGAKILKKYNQGKKLEIDLLQLFKFQRTFKFIPINTKLPIVYPGGVPGIRAPP